VIPVLTYHDVGDLPPPLGISLRRFKAHVAWLQERGVSIVPLGHVLDSTARGADRGPAVSITFDDGYASVARHALPILARAGATASVFAVAGRVGTTNAFPGQPSWVPVRPLASWDALREMQSAGWTVDAHSFTHGRLDRMTAEEVDDELRRSIETIAAEIGSAPRHFAYPYGRHTDVVRAVAARYHDAAWTATPGVATHRADRYALPRVDACDVSTLAVFRLLTSSMLQPYLAVRRTLRQMRTMASE
jgi:peptidoglycan/xylan/chitin deacetylase (PgdA/CDA1 family)